MRSMTRSALRGPVFPAVIATASLVALLGTIDKDRSTDNGTDEPNSGLVPITLVEGSAVAPSDTLKDWAATADYAVTAEVTDERQLPMPTSETSDPDDELVGREVTLSVHEVLWKAGDAPTAPPKVFKMTAFGWHQTDAGLSEVAAVHSSRLEVGHTYLLALAWINAQCDVGDEPTPARWTLIGPGGAVPADGSDLGQGEFEGAVVTPGELQATTRSTPATVQAQYSGESAADVSRDLKTVQPPRNHAFRQLGHPCT